MTNQPALPTLKVYVVSFMVHSTVIDPNNEKPDTYTDHLPSLIFADSIETAASQAATIAFKSWLVDEGWFGHVAVIIPVTQAFFAKLQPYLDAGILPDTGIPEATQKFILVDRSTLS